MLKKWFKQRLPKPSAIKKEKSLQVLGRMLHHPNLWHLNRYSVATGVSIGLFLAFIPIPLQMLLAAILSILLHANLPIAIALTWITNPLTTGPIAYAAYYVGSKILQTPHEKFHFEPTFEWLKTQFDKIAFPFLLGTILFAVLAALLGNIFIRLLWRFTVSKAWRERQISQTQKKAE